MTKRSGKSRGLPAAHCDRTPSAARSLANILPIQISAIVLLYFLCRSGPVARDASAKQSNTPRPTYRLSMILSEAAIRFSGSPMLCCVVARGIAAADDLRTIGRVGVETPVYFEMMTSAAPPRSRSNRRTIRWRAIAAPGDMEARPHHHHLLGTSGSRAVDAVSMNARNPWQQTPHPSPWRRRPDAGGGPGAGASLNSNGTRHRHHRHMSFTGNPVPR